MLDVSQSAQSAIDRRYSRPSNYSRNPLEYPCEHPPEHPLLYQWGYSAKGQVYEGLGASAPVGAGADESASLRLIKTARLPICKRPRRGPSSKQVNHIEWPIRT